MCKSHNPRVIDKCIKVFIDNLRVFSNRDIYKIVACCCGHGVYPPTIVVKAKYSLTPERTFDLVSGAIIPRKTRFYKKDGKGYYYIPEALSLSLFMPAKRR